MNKYEKAWNNVKSLAETSDYYLEWTRMDKDKLLEYLEIMCKRCTNHEICQGTGCTPKKEIKKYIDEKG